MDLDFGFGRSLSDKESRYVDFKGRGAVSAADGVTSSEGVNGRLSKRPTVVVCFWIVTLDDDSNCACVGNINASSVVFVVSPG